MSPEAEANIRRARNKLLIVVLVPTVLMVAAICAGAVLLHRSDVNAANARDQTARVAATATRARIRLAASVAALALAQSEGACRRGDVNRAYLRWRAQHISTPGASPDIARQLFPILDCADPARRPLGKWAQILFIERVVKHPTVDPFLP